MAKRSIHCKLGVVDKYGNVLIVSPKTTGEDIYIRENEFKKGTNLQTLVNNLGDIAFNKTFMGIGDKDTANTVKTWSANKIVKEFYDISVINAEKVAEFKKQANIILNSITNHGVTAVSTDTIVTLCNKVAQVYSNYNTNGYNKGIADHTVGNAKASEGLTGATWTSTNGGLVEGTAVRKGNFTKYLAFGETYELTDSAYYTSFTVGRYKSAQASTSVQLYPDAMGANEEKVVTTTVTIPLIKSVRGSDLNIMLAGFSSINVAADATFTDWTSNSEAKLDMDYIEVDHQSINTSTTYNAITFTINIRLESRGTNTSAVINPIIQGTFECVYTYV